MRWMVAALALASLVLLPGCLQAALEETVGDEGSIVPATAMLRDPASPSAKDPGERSPEDPALLAPGLKLEWQAQCPCPMARFVAAPGTDPGAWLEVRVRWDGTAVADLVPRLDLPDGSTLRGERGFDDRLIRAWGPQAGDHWLAIDGEGMANVSVRLGSLALPGEGPLLPNLVEMVLEGPHVGGCDAVETSEQGAVKCMRFGNGVANPGHGPVQIRLTVEQAAQALLPLDGRFVQEIRQADGSLEEHPVGPAQFHATHGHWHYDGLAVFDLYAVDEASGLRGPLAASHGKAGFCFLDWDRMVENVSEPAEQERAETDCLVPGLTGSWTNGISRGWYDFYVSGLTDQYVDIDGLPDGIYELVASADPLGTLDELDETDNQSSLLLRIAGDEIDVLEERAHYRVQEEDDA